MLSSSRFNMYTKCDALAKAQKVNAELHVRNVVSWNALIAGHARHGQDSEAFSCFERIRGEGLTPNSVTFLCILKACRNKAAADKGKQIHNEVVSMGLLENDYLLGTALVDMYAKCGMLAGAQRLHDQLCKRDVVSWSALIGGYAQHGPACEAFNCFGRMQSEGISPNEVTFLCILRMCVSTHGTTDGKKIHSEIVIRGLLNRTSYLSAALVDMYAKCGMLTEAQQVHDEFCVQNVVSWSALITGYTRQQKDQEAFRCFKQMQGKGLSPDVVAFSCILKTCGSMECIDEGKKIHDRILSNGLLKENIILGTALMDMYIKCGVPEKAQEVHDGLEVRDVVSWSALVAGFSQHGQGHKALSCFEQMQREGFCPNVVTYLAALKGCGDVRSIDKGKRIHEEIVNKCLLHGNAFLGTALVDMYGKCGLLSKAQEVHYALCKRDVVSWFSLIARFAEQGRGHEAIQCFEQMLCEGLSPDAITLACVLKTCGSIGAIEKGRSIHYEILGVDLLENNITVGAALVDMYAKCGILPKAREVHDDLQVRDVASWNALIAGYLQQRQDHEAFNCFEQMQGEGIDPNMTTFLCILKACGNIGAIVKGNQIHNELAHSKFFEHSTVLGSALVDMYASCGLLTKAQQVHDKICLHTALSWTALIEGYAQQGLVSEALNCFEQMQHEGLCPDAVIFLSVLNACSHSGRLDESLAYFRRMVREYRIKPRLEHYTCMVVVLGRAGLFDKVISVMKMMPTYYPTIWLVILGACRKWGNTKLGMLAFDQILQLDCGCIASACVVMANIFTYFGMEEDAVKIKELKLNNRTGIFLDERKNLRLIADEFK